MNTAKAKQYLSHTATLLRRTRERVDRLDANLVEQDIAARRQEALIGYEFAKQVDRIEAALQSIKSNLDLDQWCKQTCVVTSARCAGASGSFDIGGNMRERDAN
jgi:hypothetical protein